MEVKVGLYTLQSPTGVQRKVVVKTVSARNVYFVAFRNERESLALQSMTITKFLEQRLSGPDEVPTKS